ncbi:lipid A biosynthesis lauroyl acyltransferase [Thiomicrorhabdus hydrogeniphila]
MSKTSKTKHVPEFSYQFLHPKYWGIWLGIGLLRLLAFIPYKQKFKVGKLLGKIIYLIAGKRRRLAKANIDLCFPEKTEIERNQILKEHFNSIGIAVIEMTIVWWGNHKHNHNSAFERGMVNFIGEHNLHQAQQQGKGVLILSPHFTTVELSGLFVSFLTNYYTVYRPHDNPLMDYLIGKGRSIQLDNGEHVEPVSKNNTRQMLKVLKAGKVMILLPDQRYRAKGHIEVPFFGVSAKSNPATSKIAKMTGCTVVPAFTRRLDNNQYELEFMPALENFPSGDDYQDTLRLHHIYEEEIRRNPSQYLWVHNRWNLKDY